MGRPLLVFMHLAKTGGRTFDTVLRGSYGAAYVQAEAWRPHRPLRLDDPRFIIPTYDRRDVRRLLGLVPWAKAIGGHPLTLESAVHDIVPVRYVAFMREPLSRGASHYQYHVATNDRPLSWADWCRCPEHHDHQTRFFDPGGDSQAAMEAIERHGVFIGLLERFEESLVLLQRLVAPELRVQYRRRNTAVRSDLAREILEDPQRVAAMRRSYGADMALYERVRDELWPRYEAAYGPGLAEDAARLKADPESGFRVWHDRAGRALHRFWVGPAFARSRRRHHDDGALQHQEDLT